MKKQIIAKLLVLCMVVSMLPALSLTGTAEASGTDNGCYGCATNCNCANSAYCTCGGAGANCDCPVCAALGLHSTATSGTTGTTSKAPSTSNTVTSKTEVTATVDGEKATAEVTAKAVTDLIAKAAADAKAANKTSVVVEIVIEAAGDNLTEVEVTIPASVFANLASTLGDLSLKVQLDLPVSNMKLSLGQSALSKLAGTGNIGLDAKKNSVTRGVRRSADADPVGYTIDITENGTAVADLPFSVSVDADAGNAAVVVVGGTEYVDNTSLVKNGTAYVNLPGSASFYLDTLSAKTFTDIAGTSYSWAQANVDFASARGLFGGITDTTFGPDVDIERAMMVTVLYRMANEPTVTGSASFTDLEAGWYYLDAVNWAATKGIDNGTSSTTFAPHEKATREELAMMLYNYAVSMSLDTSARGDLNGFSDASSVSANAETAVQWAVGAGIIGGNNGRLNATDNVVRAEAAAMLYRFCEYLAG